jgi:hypothetical protein
MENIDCIPGRKIQRLEREEIWGHLKHMPPPGSTSALFSFSRGTEIARLQRTLILS